MHCPLKTTSPRFLAFDLGHNLLAATSSITGAAALVAITEARQVAALGPNSSAVYELVRAQVLTEPGADKNSANRQLLSLLKVRGAARGAGSEGGVG